MSTDIGNIPSHLIFDGYIPDLNDLMPKNGGLTGVEYAQICVHNLMKAQASGLLDVADTEYYLIIGPNGTVTMRLMAYADTPPVQPQQAGACECYLDPDVEKHTGLEIGDQPNVNNPKLATKSKTAPTTTSVTV